MSRGLPFGSLCNVDSPIRRMDPRVKIYLFIIYTITAFLMDTPAGMVAIAALIMTACAMSKIPARRILGSLRACWAIFLIPIVFNLFNPDGIQLVSAGWITITDLGLYRAVFFASRLLLVFVAASLMLLATSALEFCDAAEWLLRPFGRLGAPVEDISMIISIAIRFIPVMGEEYASIRDAQAARGAVFDEGGPIRRARALIPVLAPLLAGAFRRTESLAEAMESRCYGCGVRRTRYRELAMRPSDWAALAVVSAFGVASMFWL